jgi:O-antigen ligase
MKWPLFFVALALAYLAGRWLRVYPRIHLRLWTVLGLLPFIKQPGMGIVLDTIGLGDSHGLEVALIDLLAVVLFAAETGPRRSLPYRSLLLLYLAASILSVPQAENSLSALFYVWKLLRYYFVFMVLTRAAQNPDVPPAVLKGMMIGVLYQFVLVLWQRYALGFERGMGVFTHQNSLGMALNLVLMTPIALILARKARPLTLLAPATGLIACVLTLSRGSLIFFGLGAVLVFLLSSIRGLATRKMWIAFGAIVLAVGVFAALGNRIVSRFETAHAGSMEVRKDFEHAASLMLDDQPMGVGANHFAFMMLHRGYASRAGVDWVNAASTVHNIYWLTLAELGYFGLVALLALFLVPLATSLWYGLKSRGDIRGDVLIGLSVGLATSYLHGTVEWAWRQTAVSFIYWILLALSAALVRQVRDSSPARSPS